MLRGRANALLIGAYVQLQCYVNLFTAVLFHLECFIANV